MLPVVDRKNIDAGRAVEKILVDLCHLRPPAKPGHGRIGSREEVVMDAQLRGSGKEFGPEIVRRDQRHVAGCTGLSWLLGIVEAPRPVAGNSAEQVAVVVVLPAEELVIVQAFRQVDLMAGGTELGRAVEGLQEGPFVKRRLGLDQLAVDPVKQRVAAVGEGILQWFLDGVIGVSPRAVDVGDCVANRAGNTGLCGWIMDIVVGRVVELRR